VSKTFCDRMTAYTSAVIRSSSTGRATAIDVPYQYLRLDDAVADRLSQVRDGKDAPEHAQGKDQTLEGGTEKRVLRGERNVGRCMANNQSLTVVENPSSVRILPAMIPGTNIFRRCQGGILSQAFARTTEMAAVVHRFVPAGLPVTEW